MKVEGSCMLLLFLLFLFYYLLVFFIIHRLGRKLTVRQENLAVNNLLVSESQCSLTTFCPSVKQEPEEIEIKKSEAIFKPPPLPEPEVLSDLLHRWSLSKSDKLFFVQLPDSLPGQPPTKERRPVKTEVQAEDGQSVLLKMETEVIASYCCVCPTQDGNRGICAG